MMPFLFNSSSQERSNGLAIHDKIHSYIAQFILFEIADASYS